MSGSFVGRGCCGLGGRARHRAARPRPVRWRAGQVVSAWHGVAEKAWSASCAQGARRVQTLGMWPCFLPPHLLRTPLTAWARSYPGTLCIR